MFPHFLIQLSHSGHFCSYVIFTGAGDKIKIMADLNKEIDMNIGN